MLIDQLLTDLVSSCQARAKLTFNYFKNTKKIPQLLLCFISRSRRLKKSAIIA